MSENGKIENEPTDHGEVVRHPGARISWAWLFPLLAAAATTWLFWTNWKSEGPEVEIQFGEAPGIQAGKTPLVYRGVTAGTVTALKLDPSLKKVLLTVRLKAFAASLAREGTVFWIDQPVVGLGKTTGLESLIQGNSLAARMGDGPPARQFVGVERPPLTPLESPALVLKLRAPNIPFLERGSPLFYRGITVGVIEDKALDEAGNPYLRVVVEKEFAGAVRGNARFWPVPAASLQLSPRGVKLDLQSLKTILLGGVEFDVFGTPGDAVKSGEEFELFANEVAAGATGEPVAISFRDGQGIIAGQTQVRHLGLPIGYVETARLNEAEQTVDTIVRFQPAYEHLHTAGTTFTLVRPQISLQGVSGLETLVGGVYIDCAPGADAGIATSFEGRSISDEGLLIEQAERGGVRVTLHAKNLPPLGENAPILFRGLVAGRVKAKGIGADNEPFLDAVIRKEFVGAVTRNARFWRIPPLSAQAGPGILKVDVAGLQTLVQGGVAFDVFDVPGAVAGDGAKFELFSTESAARATSPPIRITFENGQGLLAGQTQVRYLGVPVGLVDAVSAKNGKVEATVRLDAGYDFLRGEGSAFSIVRLDVSINGVSGLETVVSGIYIECIPGGKGGRLAENFVGVSANKAAFKVQEEHGLEVVVTAGQSNIGVGAPVSYRGLIVGKVGRKVLSDDGKRVGLSVIIKSPYDGLIRENTKFWDASGLKISLGFFSLKMQAGSLDSLALGGLAFATPDNPDMGAPVKPGHEFDLNPGSRPEWLRWSPTIPAGR